MAQEDDLRALGKIMDFMRGISVLFLLINCYWFCYSAFETWHFTLTIIEKSYSIFNVQRLVLLHAVDKALLCSLPWAFLPRHQGRQRRKDNVGNDLFSPSRGLCVILSQLVGLVLTHIGSRCSITLHLLFVSRLYLPIDGWSVDESFAQNFYRTTIKSSSKAPSS